MADKTSVQVLVKTKDRLVKRGKKGETYDDIIRRLLDDTICPILRIPYK